jgi:hypothetical protein
VKEDDMLSTHYPTGTPVRATHRIDSLAGDIPAGWQGTVEYLTEDMAHRMLYAVRWEMNGKISLAYESDLEKV